MYCSKCGAKIEASDKFCERCGNSLIEESIPSTNIAPAPVIVNNTVNIQQPEVKQNKKIDINKILIMCIIAVSIFVLGGLVYALSQTNSKRVIMIYMAGADLESNSGLATRDLQDLDYNKTKSNKTEVILIAGGAKSWKNDYISVSETSIYRLTANGFQKINVRPRDNMGSSENLSYFLNYVYKNFRANKYDFIYWNHGGAVDGSEYDELSNSDNLQLYEMAAAFNNSPFKGRNKLETISFRTCLNSTIEVANVYKNYSKYLVASEEVTRGAQADSALRFINEINASDTGIDFGKKQINNYKELVVNICNATQLVQEKENYCVNSTYSITDLSKVDNIQKNLDVFSTDLKNNLSSNYANYSKIRSNISQYGDDIPEYDMIDLYNLSEKYDKFSNNGNNLRKSIEEAIIYNWSNNNYSHGLSIYFPYNGAAFLGKYEQIAPSKSYSDFLYTFINAKNNTKQTNFSTFQTKVETKKDKKNKVVESDVELELSEEEMNNLANANYLVLVDRGNGYYKALYKGKKVEIEGNKIKAAVKGRMLRISDVEYDDDSGWLTAYEEDVTDDYVDLRAPVYLQNTAGANREVTADLYIRIDKKHPNGYVRSISINRGKATNNKEFNVFSPEQVKLTDYDFIQSMSGSYKWIDANGNYNPNLNIKTDGNGIIDGVEYRTNEVKFIKENFKDGNDYYLVFFMKDISGNISYSKPIKMN